MLLRVQVGRRGRLGRLHRLRSAAQLARCRSGTTERSHRAGGRVARHDTECGARHDQLRAAHQRSGWTCSFGGGREGEPGQLTLDRRLLKLSKHVVSMRLCFTTPSPHVSLIRRPFLQYCNKSMNHFCDTYRKNWKQYFESEKLFLRRYFLSFLCFCHHILTTMINCFYNTKTFCDRFSCEPTRCNE